MRRWLPYAGITRIRFEGFSFEFSVLSHTPSRFLYIIHCRMLSKMRCGKAGAFSDRPHPLLDEGGSILLVWVSQLDRRYSNV